MKAPNLDFVGNKGSGSTDRAPCDALSSNTYRLQNCISLDISLAVAGWNPEGRMRTAAGNWLRLMVHTVVEFIRWEWR
jgi:hypothetical protein